MLLHHLLVQPGKAQNTFTKKGHVFQGWAKSEAATQAEFSDKVSFSTPAQNTSLYAVWKAKDFTITYKANGGVGSDYTQTVAFGKNESLISNTFSYQGYRLAGWMLTSDGDRADYSDNADFVLSEEENLILYALWVEADRHIITYKNTKGVTNSSPSSYRETEGAQLYDLSLTGYIFDGWFDSQDLNGNGTGNKIQSWGANAKTGDITLYAKWSPRTDTAYKVEHYQQNADDDDYTLVEIDNKTGTTDADTVAQTKAYEHFTAQSITQIAIAPDGSSVVKVYYNRDSVTMTFNLAGGKIGNDSSVELTGKYGSSYTVGTPDKTGWTFANWNPALPEKMKTGAYTATYTANTNTAYKVFHYQQNANDDEYILKDTDNKTGTTEEQTQAAAKDYDHFTAKTFEQVTIAADGSTEISIYYDREIIIFTLELDGGTLNAETIIRGKYGQTVLSNPVPEKQGYSFEGWNTTGGTLPQTFETTATYTAKWSSVKGITIKVSEADIDVTKTVNGNTVTFTAETCDSYAWYLDDVLKDSGQTFEIDTSTMVKGTYTLVLEAQKGGRWYSYYAQIKVE